MNQLYLVEALSDHISERLSVDKKDSGWRIELPLLEIGGDAVSIYVRELDANTVEISDGGHISGMFFEAGLAGGLASDGRGIGRVATDAGLAVDSSRGVVYVQTNIDTVGYWTLELGRTIVVASALVPTMRPRTRAARRLGPRVASALIRRLVDEGLRSAIHFSKKVTGVTQRERVVDVTYTVPKTPLEDETTVHVLAVDLDVRDPVAKANRSLEIAADLSAIDDRPVIRVVHGAGESNGRAEPATKLLHALSERQLFEGYSWDDTNDQTRFIEKVEQELGPLVTGISQPLRGKRRTKFAVGDRVRANSKGPSDYRGRVGEVTEYGPGRAEYGVRFDGDAETSYVNSWWLDRANM